MKQYIHQTNHAESCNNQKYIGIPVDIESKIKEILPFDEYAEFIFKKDGKTYKLRYTHNKTTDQPVIDNVGDIFKNNGEPLSPGDLIIIEKNDGTIYVDVVKRKIVIASFLKKVRGSEVNAWKFEPEDLMPLDRETYIFIDKNKYNVVIQKQDEVCERETKEEKFRKNTNIYSITCTDGKKIEDICPDLKDGNVINIYIKDTYSVFEKIDSNHIFIELDIDNLQLNDTTSI